MNEINVQRSKLMGNMLHIEFLDGNSFLYSLEEIVEIIADKQSAQENVCYKSASGDHLWQLDGNSKYCIACGNRKTVTQTTQAESPSGRSNTSHETLAPPPL